MALYNWEPVEDGEYGEQSTTVNGHDVHIYTNRYGDSWEYTIDGGESVGSWDTREETQRAAIEDAKSTPAP